MIHPFDSLPENLAAFCGVLRRDHGFHIGPGEVRDAARALEITNLLDERAVRDALRPVLAGTLDQARAFDPVFDRFFLGRGAPPAREALAAAASEAPAPGRGPAARVGVGGNATAVAEAADEEADAGSARARVHDVSEDVTSGAAGLLRASYSPVEAEGAAPDLEPPDRAWIEAASRLVQRVRTGRSRRWRPAWRGPRFDLRRTLRISLHTGGEVLWPRFRARRRRRPRFVLLIDGSRSMAARAHPALRMAVALTSVAPDTETFTFSTALRRVTREVGRAASGQRQTIEPHHAWGGGTTIGACLQAFLRRYGERLLGRDTVAVVVSDGLDVGEPALLREAMARLSRESAAVVWLNPLLDTPGYAPTALGMRTARPFVTTFTSVSDPAGLVKLAREIRIG